MSTVGHLVTMIGALAFYFMLLDSKLEKKLSASLVSLVPRLSKRPLYYIAKEIEFYLNKKLSEFYPTLLPLRSLHDFRPC